MVAHHQGHVGPGAPIVREKLARRSPNVAAQDKFATIVWLVGQNVILAEAMSIKAKKTAVVMHKQTARAMGPFLSLLSITIRVCAPLQTFLKP